MHYLPLNRNFRMGTTSTDRNSRTWIKTIQLNNKSTLVQNG